MRLKYQFLIMVVLIILGGCSQANKFEPDSFSKDDLAIIKEDDPKFKLSYGMSKTDVEKLLGKAKEDDSTNFRIFSYDFGVTIMYREDMVAAIMLSDDSKEIYQTARGASVGMTKEQIKEVYGSKYAVGDHDYNINYIYDSKNDRFIESSGSKEPEDLEQIYSMSAKVVDGEVDSIFLMDYRIGTLMN